MHSHHDCAISEALEVQVLRLLLARCLTNLILNTQHGVTLQSVVFSGVRFEVESAASLVFSTDAPTEFTGINDLVRQIHFRSFFSLLGGFRVFFFICSASLVVYISTGVRT